MSSGRELRRSASLVLQSILCQPFNTAILSASVWPFLLCKEFSKELIILTYQNKQNLLWDAFEQSPHQVKIHAKPEINNKPQGYTFTLI